MTVSAKEWLWREWRLGEGRFKGLGPCSKPRPAELPKRIPMTWWARLVAFLARRKLTPKPTPPPPRSRALFDHRYCYVRDPRSGSMLEKLDALRTAGYQGVALNVGDHDAADWGDWRTAAATRGLVAFPWARCYVARDVERLVSIGQSWGARALIVNLEQNAGSPRWAMTGPQVAAALAPWAGQIGVSTEPYMPENFDWGPLIQLGAVDLPQTHAIEFPQYPPGVVAGRAAGTFGWASPRPSFGTYPIGGVRPTRAIYDWAGLFGIYTLDDLQPHEIGSWT